MPQTEVSQRPGHGKNEIDQGEGIEHHRAPLREEWRAAVAQWIPERNLASPKTLPMIKMEGISKHPIVPKVKTVEAKDNWCESQNH
jgi:hypothetical protein